jgi:hypothetical protein
MLACTPDPLPPGSHDLHTHISMHALSAPYLLPPCSCSGYHMHMPMQLLPAPPPHSHLRRLTEQLPPELLGTWVSATGVASPV